MPIKEKIQHAVQVYLEALIKRAAVEDFTSLHQFPQGVNFNLKDDSKITLFVNKKVTEKTTGFSFPFTGIVREFKNNEAVYHNLNVNWGVAGIKALENIYDVVVFCRYKNFFQSVKIKPQTAQDNTTGNVLRTIYQPVSSSINLRRTANVYDKLAIRSDNYHHIICHNLEEDLWLVHYINFADSKLKRFELLLQNFPYTYSSKFGRVPKSEEELNIYAQILKFMVYLPEWNRVKFRYQAGIERDINKEIIDLFLRRTRLAHKPPEVILQKILTAVILQPPRKILIPGARVEKEATIDSKREYHEIVKLVSSYLEVKGFVDLEKEISYTKPSLPMQESTEEQIEEPSPSSEGLEKTLIDKWQKKSEPGEASKAPPELDMLPQERGHLQRLQKEDPQILSEIMSEKEAPLSEAPPSEPPQAEKVPGSLSKILFNILIVLLIIGAAAVTGYLYTSKTGGGLPKFPLRLPSTSEVVQPPLETTPSSKVPSPPEATPSMTPVTAWERYRNETLRYSFVAPQNWSVEMGEVIESVTTVSNFDPKIKSVPQQNDLVIKIGIEEAAVDTDSFSKESFGDMIFAVEKTTESLNYYLTRDTELFSIKVTPVNYNQVYSNVIEKILSKFLFFTPVEESEMQEYTNTIDNYTMKYPTTWADKGLTTSEFGLFKNFSSGEAAGVSEIQRGEVWLSLGYLDKANLETYKGSAAASQYFNYLSDQTEGQARDTDVEYTITKIEELTVSGLSAVKQSEEKASLYLISLYILRGNKIFQISATSTDEGTFLNFEREIDKIIASVSFTGAAPL